MAYLGSKCVPPFQRVLHRGNLLKNETKTIRTDATASNIPVICAYKKLIVGVPKESFLGERRVALTPMAAALLCKHGFRVQIESQAGTLSSFRDHDYEKYGATIVDKEAAFGSDIVLKYNPPTLEETHLFRDQATIFSFLYPAKNLDMLKELAMHKLTAFAMDCIPKIPHARTFDVLSPLQSIAGYRAVVEASHHFGRSLSGQITSSGNIPPAKVLVIGDGEAAIAAVKHASSIGALIRIIDGNPSLKTDMESFGMEVLSVRSSNSSDPEYRKNKIRLIREQCPHSDIIITSSYNGKAPVLITRDMVETLKPGSVIVDLAANHGGNVEVTRPGEVIHHNGVILVGSTDLTSQLPNQASSLYANVVSKFLLTIDGARHHNNFSINEVILKSMVINNGQITWSPNMHDENQLEAKESTEEKEEASAPVDPFKTKLRRSLMYTAGSLAILGMGSPNPAFTAVTSTLGLSAIIGYHTIWSVYPPLFSPLMAFNVAISGMEAVGGLYLMGGGYFPSTTLEIMSATAVFFSFCNIFGGLFAADRMLDAYIRPKDPSEYKYLHGILGGSFLSFYSWGVMNGYPEINKMAYLVSSLFCIGAIAGLINHSTSRKLTTFGMIGMSGGIAATVGTISPSIPLLVQMAGVAVGGAVVGTAITKSIDVTKLSPLVAAYHALVGVAAVFTCFATFACHFPHFCEDPTTVAEKVALVLSTYIGGVTISGSALAYCKIVGLTNPAPVLLPGRHAINTTLLAANLLSMGYFMQDSTYDIGMLMMGSTAALSTIMGITLTLPVGSADMPVVITTLNSLSGWAICAEGFMLNNTLLTVIGSLIGSTGCILSYIMSTSQNRTVFNVLKGGFGMEPKPEKLSGVHTEWSSSEATEALEIARNIIIVPGYGLIAGRGQYHLAKIVNLLLAQGKKVKFGIHPVGGRMFGQLNVLLAQAGVDYEIIHDMVSINREFQNSDLVLVVGANDTVNSAADEDPKSPIAGMQVLKVWKSRQVVVINNTVAGGYACLENPTFYKDNTAMVVGDSGKICNEILEKLKSHYQVNDESE